MKESKILAICGALLCIASFVVICVRLFGDYPPSNFNYIWLGGAIVGAMLAAPLFDKEK